METSPMKRPPIVAAPSSGATVYDPRFLNCAMSVDGKR